MSFICHIHNYTENNQQWNVFSAFKSFKWTHTWSSGQPTQQRLGSSWGFGALLKGLTSVMDNSCQSRDLNPQPRVTSLTLYPLEPRLPPSLFWRVSIPDGIKSGAYVYKQDPHISPWSVQMLQDEVQSHVDLFAL